MSIFSVLLQKLEGGAAKLVVTAGEHEIAANLHPSEVANAAETVGASITHGLLDKLELDAETEFENLLGQVKAKINEAINPAKVETVAEEVQKTADEIASVGSLIPGAGSVVSDIDKGIDVTANVVENTAKELEVTEQPASTSTEQPASPEGEEPTPAS